MRLFVCSFICVFFDAEIIQNGPKVVWHGPCVLNTEYQVSVASFCITSNDTSRCLVHN